MANDIELRHLVKSQKDIRDAIMLLAKVIERQTNVMVEIERRVRSENGVDDGVQGSNGTSGERQTNL